MPTEHLNLKIGNLSFCSRPNLNFNADFDKKEIPFGANFFVSHHVKIDKDWFYLCSSVASPTGNCQLFSIIQMNNLINSIESLGKRGYKNLVLPCLQYINYVNCKKMCFIDINSGFRQKFHDLFDPFILECFENKYVSTNGSHMVSILVKFKDDVTYVPDKKQD